DGRRVRLPPEEAQGGGRALPGGGPGLPVPGVAGPGVLRGGPMLHRPEGQAEGPRRPEDRRQEVPQTPAGEGRHQADRGPREDCAGQGDKVRGGQGGRRPPNPLSPCHPCNLSPCQLRRVLMSRLLRLTVLALLLLLSAGAAPAQAQEGEAPARNPPETLLELIVAGGPLNVAFLAVLGLFSLVGLTVILERLVN